MPTMPSYDGVNAGLASTPITAQNTRDTLAGSAEKRYDSAMAGTERAQGLLKTDSSFEKGLGGSGADPAMSAAIMQKQGRQQSLDQAQLKMTMKNKSEEGRFQQLMKAHEMAGQEQQMNFQKAMAAYKAKMAKQASRNAMIGQILGLTGAIAGGVAGGAPGAMMGQAGGQAVGMAATGGF